MQIRPLDIECTNLNPSAEVPDFRPCQHPKIKAPVNHSAVGILSDSLELLLAPGDVLSVRGTHCLSAIGRAGGIMGHVMVVVAPPLAIRRQSAEAARLMPLWPEEGTTPMLWQVPTLESMNGECGLHRAKTLLYVERRTGRFAIAGEIDLNGDVWAFARREVEVWQSPLELRSRLCLDLMGEVVCEMMARNASWSLTTAARAVLTSAKVTIDKTPAEVMEEIFQSWEAEPICTSIVISFWQRYLCKLAGVARGKGNPQTAVSLIIKWMPLKADRGLPGELLRTMQSVGWVLMTQVPRIFHPAPAPISKAFAPKPQTARDVMFSMLDADIVQHCMEDRRKIAGPTVILPPV